jgi:hypothetical protein|tara:strand:+ start:9270 stop:9434 length:165 start_codon:yes stop_codon:yes gene_type:complete
MIECSTQSATRISSDTLIAPNPPSRREIPVDIRQMASTPTPEMSLSECSDDEVR